MSGPLRRGAYTDKSTRTVPPVAVRVRNPKCLHCVPWSLRGWLTEMANVVAMIGTRLETLESCCLFQANQVVREDGA